MVKPITAALKAHNLDAHLVYLNPVDPFNFYIKISLVCGAIIASPFILFQVWLFIAPGLYRQEKRYILPFMTATVGLFLAGAFFGYHYVYPGALTFLIGYGSQFRPMVTVRRIYRALYDRDPRSWGSPLSCLSWFFFLPSSAS